MQITVNGQPLFEVNATEMELLEYFLPVSTLDADLKRRLEWVLTHKIEQCHKKFREEWMPKLEKDPAVTTVPVGNEDFFNMVKVRPDYKDRATRDVEAAAELS